MLNIKYLNIYFFRVVNIYTFILYILFYKLFMGKKTLFIVFKIFNINYNKNIYYLLKFKIRIEVKVELMSIRWGRIVINYYNKIFF